MKVKVFSIYDQKAEAYLQPFFAQTEGVAIRVIQNTIDKEKDSNFVKYQADYSLFLIGTFEDDNGDLHPVMPKKCLGNFLELSNSLENVKSLVK